MPHSTKWSGKILKENVWCGQKNV